MGTVPTNSGQIKPRYGAPRGSLGWCGLTQVIIMGSNCGSPWSCNIEVAIGHVDHLWGGPFVRLYSPALVAK